MHTNLQTFIIQPQLTSEIIFNFKSTNLSHLFMQIKRKFTRSITSIVFFLTYKEILFRNKVNLLNFFTSLFLLDPFKGGLSLILVKNFSTFFNIVNFWFKYDAKVNKKWQKSAFFSLVLFTISSRKYSYRLNKRKYFQFKKDQTLIMTKFVSELFTLYFKECQQNSLVFKKISLLTDLHQHANISRFFRFSLKHLECFTHLFAFTLLTIPYMTFYSFLLDQTYIWSNLINELQVYFQKGFC